MNSNRDYIEHEHIPVINSMLDNKHESLFHFHHCLQLIHLIYSKLMHPIEDEKKKTIHIKYMYQ